MGHRDIKPRPLSHRRFPVDEVKQGMLISDFGICKKLGVPEWIKLLPTHRLLEQWVGKPLRYCVEMSFLMAMIRRISTRLTKN